MLGMNAEMLKGHLDAIVMTSIQSGALHGYAIIEEIKRRSTGVFELPEGTIYPVLHRLENHGLIVSEWSLSPTGRKRRIYRLTPKGQDALAERRRAWISFARAIDSFLVGTPT